MSNHLPIINLFKAYKGFMVSTSANISGQENMNDPREIIKYFKDTDLAFMIPILKEQNHQQL